MAYCMGAYSLQFCDLVCECASVLAGKKRGFHMTHVTERDIVAKYVSSRCTCSRFADFFIASLPASYQSPVFSTMLQYRIPLDEAATAGQIADLSAQLNHHLTPPEPSSDTIITPVTTKTSDGPNSSLSSLRGYVGVTTDDNSVLLWLSLANPDFELARDVQETIMASSHVCNFSFGSLFRKGKLGGRGATALVVGFSMSIGGLRMEVSGQPQSSHGSRRCRLSFVTTSTNSCWSSLTP